jgi:ATP-dependent Clp protease ATP-binding subunit ClpX
MPAMTTQIPAPVEIARLLEQKVIGQQEAVREMAVALAKHLAGVAAGNILMIGSSGSGKTTLMRAVEGLLGRWPELESRSTLVRIHANVLAEEARRGRPGQVILHRLLERAREVMGEGASREKLLERARHGLVFVDEVDKIRSRVGDVANVDGIRAQEALLTLIENEAVPLDVPDWAGGGRVTVDSSGILFVCAGAFEGLYDTVYDRVTIGADRGALKATNVFDSGDVRTETPFLLRDWLRAEDLFDYGMSPQFLSRFDAVVLLEPLGPEELAKIFTESSDSGLQRTRAYFAGRGVRLALSPGAIRAIATHASRQERLGARALNETFRRVIRKYELEPEAHAREGILMLDTSQVAEALGEKPPAFG